MRLTRQYLVSSVAAASLAVATPALADEWAVLAIGPEAVSVATTLASSGVQDVRVLRDGRARDIADAVLGMAGPERVMVFYSGPLTERAGQPAIGDDPRLTMAALADTLAAGGASQVAILVENCSGFGQGVEIAAPIGSLRADLLLAASAGPGDSCIGPVLTDAIGAASLSTPLENIAARGWVGAAPNGSFSLDPGSTIRFSEVRFLEPVAGKAVAELPVGNEVQTALFVAPPASAIAAIPVAAGMPVPSITVGIIQVEPVDDVELASVVETPDETDPVADDALAAAAAIDFAFDDVEARVAFREENPDLFEIVLETGALDPPPDADLAAAIQVELKRMNCYRSIIDGDFGRGSQRAVVEYYDERGLGDPPNTDPSTDLWRILIGNEDVACPTPVAQPAAPRTTSNTRTTTTRTAPRAAPAPAPAPAPAAPRRTISGGGVSIGVTR